MKKLLKFEFRKLAFQTSARVCGIIILCMAILAVRIAKANWVAYGLAVEGYPKPTAVSLTLSALSSSAFSLVLGIFVAIFISGDRSEGILRNVYAKGYSRNKVFFAKIIALCFYCLFFAILCLAINFLGGLIVFPSDSPLNYSELKVVPVQILLMLTYTSFFAMIATICKRTGSAVAGCVLVPTLASLAFILFDTFAGIDGFILSTYWFENMFSSVSVGYASTSDVLTSVIGGIIYAIVFTALAVVVNNKTEQ